jgi:hypothetical protein
MRAASPYRIAGERPISAEPVERVAPPLVSPDSDSEIETVACEYDAPAEEPEPSRHVQTAATFLGWSVVAICFSVAVIAFVAFALWCRQD